MLAALVAPPLRRRLMIGVTKFPRPEGTGAPPWIVAPAPTSAARRPQPPFPQPVALTWTALTEGHWSLVVTKDTGSVAASLSPAEHALSDNREYLIGALEDGWWLAVEVDGKLTALASPFPSEEAARQRAGVWEANHR
jgi:hypothetical protein